MLTYRNRPRVLKCNLASSDDFPADCTIEFSFSPGQPFGAVKDDGRSFLIGGNTAHVDFNLFTGQYSVWSDESLKPLEAQLGLCDYSFEWHGSKLLVTHSYSSIEDLTRHIETIYYLLPLHLSVDFADPVYCTKIIGTISGNEFSWELLRWQVSSTAVTQDGQEEFSLNALQRLHSDPQLLNLRALGALNYFHVACRLARCSSVPGEFLSEQVLNLCKALECLFPASGNSKTRDAVRDGLTELGYCEDEIEMRYIPVMALRDQLDVAHVVIDTLPPQKLKTIHEYVDNLEGDFRRMFKSLIEKIEAGEFTEAEYFTKTSNQSKIDHIIERINSYKANTK